MKTKIVLLSIIILSGFIFPQSTGKISGKITDDKDEPLYGATIIVENTSHGAVADINGYYFIINLPPGTYSLKASSIGYTSEVYEDVKVSGGLTTKVDFILKTSVVQMKEVVIQFQRPAIQKDLTSKQQEINFEDVQNLPTQGTITDVITKQAGITKDISTIPVTSQPVFGQFATIPNDGLHFRGGRTNETLYLLDGIPVNDKLWGGFDLDVFGEYSLESMRTLTGTFGPQYGEAMSGVIEMQTLDNVVDKYTLNASGSTDNLGEWSGEQNTKSFEFASSGPVIGINNLTYFLNARSYTTDGYIYGYIYPDYVDSRGTDKSGTPITVPMNFRDNELLIGKLIYEPTDELKLRVGYYTSNSVNGMYNHYFKYNPYGTPNQDLKDYLVYGKITDVLSPSTFYDITISKYSRNFDAHVYDTPDAYAVIPAIQTAEFSIAGEDWVYFQSQFEQLEGQASISSQITKQQFIKAGFTLSQLRTQLVRLNPVGFVAIEDYDIKPIEGSAYINDKMEFEDIGMIINVGLRYDYINPNRIFITDIESPNGTVGKVKPLQYISPRIGISYPISDVAAFHFGYGHYYQYPAFYEAFQGMNVQSPLYPNVDVSEVSGAIGKGDIQEEKTINYEAGVQLKVTNDISADITGFYRKTYNLIGIEIIQGYVSSGGVEKAENYPIFDNVNFATVQGVEISITKRLTSFFSGFLNYTYSQALVSSSLVLSLPQDVTRTFPADWDQPHTLSFGAIFQFSDGWGFSFLGNASSGLPYTYNQAEPNAERAPWIGSFDFMVNKEFEIWSGFKAKLFGQIFNLLNRRNIYWVYPDSGLPGVDTDPAHSYDYTNNPSEWGPGRRFQVGLSINY
jgi:hypothetical protein